jgi:uncharacterized repeat protein (TIGR02543 family)
VLLKADSVNLGSTVSATSGVVTITPASVAREIDLGSEAVGKLSLTSTEINRIQAGTLRIGELNGSNTGAITVSAAIAPTGTDTLAIRTDGAVSGSGSITEVNLAIDAASINLPGGNQISGGLALNATAVTYTQTLSEFTPRTVDSITPIYGVASKVALTDVPTNTPINKFMAVTFTPPPVVTLQDSFSNPITAANSLAESFTVTATIATGTGNLPAENSVTTVDGVATFSDLSISDQTGEHTIMFRATVTATGDPISNTPSQTTGIYNIQRSQTISFGTTPSGTPRVNGASYTPTASSTSGLAVTITVAPASSAICSISAGEVTFQGIGTCTLLANQAGNSTFAAAAQVQQSFSVATAKLLAPATLNVSATATTLKSLSVSWSAVTGASSYTVKIYDAPGTGPEKDSFVGIVGTSTTINTGLSDGTQYFVSVTAISSSAGASSDERSKVSATTLSPAASPTIDTQPISRSRTPGQSVSFSVVASKADAGVLSYQWRKDGSNISGATLATYTIGATSSSDAGAYSVVVTNSLNGTNATTTSSAATLTMASALSITTPSSQSATVNLAYSLTLSASGGLEARTFTTSTLPAGLTLNSGVVSGTPTTAGTFAVTATVTDANGATATTSSFNIVVAAAPGLTPAFATPISRLVSGSERLTVQITNYNASYTWSGTSTIGTVSIDSSGLVTFAGITSGQSPTATITTSRTNYLDASANVSGTLVPIPIVSYNSSDLNSFGTTQTVNDLSGRGNNALRSPTDPGRFDINFLSGYWKFPGGNNISGPYIDLPDLSTNSFTGGITVDFEADFGGPDTWERIIDFGKGSGSNLGIEDDNFFISREGDTRNLVVEVWRGNFATRCAAVNAIPTEGSSRWTIQLSSNLCVITRDDVELVRRTDLNMSVRSGQTWSSNFIGRSNWSNDKQFAGELKSFRLFGNSLSKSQIDTISYKDVYYFPNGGAAVSSEARRTTSGEIFLPTAVTRAGYSFQGWYDSTNVLTRTKLGDASARFTPTQNTNAYAGWSADTLNVTYNSNGGSAVLGSTTTTDTTVAEAPTSPTRTGYTFAGWFAASNLSGTAIEFPYTHGQTANFTLYAKWNANDIVATFDSNGGSVVTAGATKTAATLTAPTPPTRAGYRFDGWFAASNLSGTAITFPYTHGQTGSFTLYAKWTANTLAITYNPNGGTTVLNGSTTTDTTVSAAPTPPTRAGYRFDGWFAASNLSGTAIEFPYTHGRTADFTLYAKWTANTLAITYNPNGGTTVLNGSTTTDTTVSAAPTPPTRAGYRFDGWFAASDLSGTAIEFPHTHGQTGSFTLYAKWTANDLVATFDSNSGSLVTAGATKTAATLAEPTPPTRDGYRFDGWFAASNLSGTAIEFPYTHGRTADFTLYAKWTANTLAITYNPNGGTTVSSGSTTTDTTVAAAPTAPTRAGYDFVGWFAESNLSGTVITFPYTHGQTANFTLYAKWNAKTLVVTYDSQSGSAVDPGSVLTAGVISSEPVSTRPGYRFDGWSRTIGGDVISFESPGYAPTDTSNFTLYAKWTANTLNVTFQANGGSSVTGSTTTNTTLANPTATTRAGYTFAGWFANDALTGNQISFPYTHGQTANFTLYAKWTANPLTVTFETNGGTSVTGSTTTDTTLATPTTTTRAGYTFRGWFANQDLTGTEIQFPYTHGRTADFTLYAKWSANDLVATFNSNSGSAVTAGATTTITTLSAPTQPTRAGYTFRGWFAASDLSGTAITFPYTHGRTADFTLYAKWDANTLNISFDSKGGSTVIATTVTTSTRVMSAPAEPTKAGYGFAGWFADEELTGSAITFPYTHGKTDDFRLYAKWTANTLAVTFASNGGTDVSNGSTTTDTQVTAPTEPTKPGYGFAGWFSDPNLNSPRITFPYTHGQTGSFTLYAKWAADTLTITYDSQLGTAVEPGTILTGGTIAEEPVSTRAGYTFLGWSRTIGASVVSFASPGYSPTDTSNFTLYAKWSANTLNVTFETNGGSSVTGSTTTNTTLATPTTTTRAGYTFRGWFAASDLSGTEITFPYTHGRTADFPLYAKWSANTLNVTFETNGGSSVTGSTTTNTTLATPTTTTRAGYTFRGWFAASDLSGTEITFPYTHGRTADFPLYAKWSANSNTVIYDSQSGSAVSPGSFLTGGTIGEAPVSIRAGYTLLGWSREIGGTVVNFETPGYAPSDTEGFTLYAKWSANTLDITYNSNGGSAVSDGTTTTATTVAAAPSAPTRAGYTFAGWFATDALTGPAISFPYTHGKTDDFTLYAKWTANTLNITYQLHDGSGKTISGTTTTGATMVTGPEDPTYPGFVFEGWALSQFGEVIAFPYVHGRTADFTLHARWKAGTYTVVYQYNGADDGASVLSDTYKTDILRTGVTLPTPTRTAYTFAGWFRDLALTTPVTLQANGNYGPTTNHTIFAKWTPINYQVIYNRGNARPGVGSVPVDSRTYTIGQSASILANSGMLTRTGHTFAGWLTSSDSEDAPLNSGHTLPVSSSNIMLYPAWTPNTYSISYNLNGGSGSLSGAPTSFTYGTTSVALPTSGFTRAGYNFGGWTRDQVTNTKVADNFAPSSNANLFAIWTLKTIGFSYDKGAAAGLTVNNWPNQDFSAANFGSTITLLNLAGTTVSIGGAEHLFFGWSDGTNTYQSGDSYVMTDTSPVFTARWIKLLDVRYSFGGGTKASTDIETTDVDAECVSAGLCIPNQQIRMRGTPTRAGYIFNGWRGQDGLLRPANSLSALTVITSTNFLFHADWTPVRYELALNPVGGSGEGKEEQLTIGELFTMTNPGSKTGYTFKGWSADGGTTLYIPGSTFVVGSESLTFDAIWAPNVYTINYDWQGAIGPAQEPSSYTVGTTPPLTPATLPAQLDRFKDGFRFDGWSTTPGGPAVTNYQPTADGVLYAKWVNGNYSISYSAQNSLNPDTVVSVARGATTILQSPTRSNFRFIGWFDALTDGKLVGVAGASYQPQASTTLYGRWVQSSFFGVDEAALETASIFTASDTTGIVNEITHVPSGSKAEIRIPAGTLPAGTKISVRYFKDDYRQKQLIGQEKTYFFSVIVSWLLGTGPTATVPDTNFISGNSGPRKPITVILSNSNIKAGAMVYRVLDGVVTPIKRAEQDGVIELQIFSDPELVIAATAPTSPRAVRAVSGSKASSVITWTAPDSDGGSELKNYDVLVDGNVVCAGTTALSCNVGNLRDGTRYNVSVIARNDIGESLAGTTSFTTLAPIATVTPPAPVAPPVVVNPPTPETPPTEITPTPSPSPQPEPAEPGITLPEITPGAPVPNPAIGASGDDSAPPVPFDPLSSPEGVAALTSTVAEVAAVAAAAAAAAAAAGAAAGGSGGGSGGGSRGAPPAGGGEAGSIATIDTAHEKYKNRRRGKGDRWKIWKKKWLNFIDKPTIALAIRSARFSPLFSKIVVDGAYLRASLGSISLLPTLFGAVVAVWSALANTADVAPPQWQWLIVIAVLGIFDTFAGFVSTTLFVITTVAMHGAISIEDVRLLLGVVIVGYGPALLANAFRAFRKEPESGDVYWWERIVDFVVLPFIGGWVTASMIGTLPALAGTTLAVANHVNDFALAVAFAIMLRVILEEAVARYFPQRLDTLHPTDVDETDPPQKWISITFRLGVFIFVTAALMGNVWQVWVGSALFILPTIIGFYSDKFKNFHWIWRILPTGIPGLAFTLLVASATTSVVGMWFGTSPDLALWSFALLPIPMLVLALLGMFGREGLDGEVRWIQRPHLKWVYRIGGIVMLLVTMNLAGVI